MQQTLFTDDEIDAFWAEKPRRAPIATARIHCRVCGAKAEQSIDTPGLLCPLCHEDLAKTEAHIRSVLAAAELAFVNAYNRHQANVEHADDETRRRYKNVEAHLGAAHEGTADPASVRRRYNEARARTDALGALLVERDKAEEIALEYQRKQAWAEVAMSEVEAAR